MNDTSSVPAPRYTIWQAINAALDLGMRALEEIRTLARQPGPPGRDGKNGLDGLSLDDMTMEYDGERTFTFKFSRGNVVKEFPFVIPFPIDRGVYKSDVTYQRGDTVTFGGSAWIAQRETTDKPETTDAWRLSVKRGRDGKDAK
jgi:hypothetical protein